MTIRDYGFIPDYVAPEDNPDSTMIAVASVDQLHLRVGAMCLRFSYSDDSTVRIMTSVRQMALKAKQCMTESSICFSPDDPPSGLLLTSITS